MLAREITVHEHVFILVTYRDSSLIQTELEECLETLSEMIARPYLRTPRSKIIHAAALVQRKRHELLTAISKGLVPTDSSPTSRKKRGRYAKEIDVSSKPMLPMLIHFNSNTYNTYTFQYHYFQYLYLSIPILSIPIHFKTNTFNTYTFQ